MGVSGAFNVGAIGGGGVKASKVIASDTTITDEEKTFIPLDTRDKALSITLGSGLEGSESHWMIFYDAGNNASNNNVTIDNETSTPKYAALDGSEVDEYVLVYDLSFFSVLYDAEESRWLTIKPEGWASGLQPV